MKYPKLKDKNDLRRKLMDKDITFLKIEYINKSKNISDRQWCMRLAEKYGVHFSTIRYYTNKNYQLKMKIKNAKNHTKQKNIQDYINHRKKESKLRVERWKRNPALREWHYIMSAKNEKRSKRITSLGKKIVW